jgi:hypothetical protein
MMNLPAISETSTQPDIQQLIDHMQVLIRVVLAT